MQGVYKSEENGENTHRIKETVVKDMNAELL